MGIRTIKCGHTDDKVRAYGRRSNTSLLIKQCGANKEVLLRRPYARTSLSVCPHFIVRMPPLYHAYT
ncbi:hypothetical protein, partial [Bacteroides heparinolyticus]|uniref:hypothetical protein n=1 Tax=Prevotella heparinolytica TaxID=28113 RepID=UPI0035A14F09